MTIDEQVPIRRRFLLLHNPVAGVRRRTLARRVARELERRGAEIVMLRFWGATAASAPGAIAKVVQLEGFDAVIAAGGDGTIRALAAALGDSTPIPVGIIPTGTGNVLASEITMPRKSAEIAEVLMTGPIMKVAGAKAGTDPFFLMAGAGFDGEVVAALNLNLKRRVGKLAYIMPILRAVMKRPRVFPVSVDGRDLEATWIVAANGRNFAGAFILAPEAKLSQPGLHAVLFTARSRTGRLFELLAVAMGLHARLPSVQILACDHVEVPEPGLAVQVDGDPVTKSPVTIRSADSSLRLIVPRSHTAA